MATQTLDLLADAIEGAHTAPDVFAEDILGADLWDVPRAVMQALAAPRARVAVRACHASSKTWTAARLVLWWVSTGGLCVTTAPTWAQVKRLLWKEIHQAHAAAKVRIGGTLNDTDLTLVRNVAMAYGLSTDEAERFQGIHGDRVLLILDEAPGVRAAIYEAIEGIRAGGDVRVLAIGNPVLPSGPFYDAFTGTGWTCFHIDAFDTPNLRACYLPGEVEPDEQRKVNLLEATDDELDTAVRPYLVTRRWVLEKWQDWGAGHPLWDSRVRGNFPSEGEDSLFKLAWLEAARVREPDPWDEDEDGKPIPPPVYGGCDVAGPGEDETVIIPQQAGHVGTVEATKQPDARGWAVAKTRERNFKRVAVDEVGIGWHFLSALKDAGVQAVGINVGKAPRNRKRFKNLKAELYWAARDALKEGRISGLTDETLRAQLMTVRWSQDSQGRICIESKEQARKRGVKSPDRAEAFILALAAEQAGGVVVAFG